MGPRGGGVAVFFKHGPFAWNGVIGFYTPIIAFVVWIGVMTYCMHTGINRQFAAKSEPAPITAEPPRRAAVCCSSNSTIAVAKSQMSASSTTRRDTYRSTVSRSPLGARDMHTSIVPARRSGSVSSVSRWSTSPPRTPVRQVPQNPCWQE
jgi:hypothetical protein